MKPKVLSCIPDPFLEAEAELEKVEYLQEDVKITFFVANDELEAKEDQNGNE